MATRAAGIGLANLINTFIRESGAFIALTGGCLYEEGERKDIDLVIYQRRQAKEIDWLLFYSDCVRHGIEFVGDYGFCKKFTWLGHDVDILWPECPDDEGLYGEFDQVDREEQTDETPE